MFYPSEAEALRPFIGDKLGFPATDVGGAWLIFDIPEADLGCHPAQTTDGRLSGTHHISFYYDDIENTVAQLKSRGRPVYRRHRGRWVRARDALQDAIGRRSRALRAEILEGSLTGCLATIRFSEFVCDMLRSTHYFIALHPLPALPSENQRGRGAQMPTYWRARILADRRATSHTRIKHARSEYTPTINRSARLLR